eukprot:4684200-Alexandrium_andersonii.AAC.1
MRSKARQTAARSSPGPGVRRNKCRPPSFSTQPLRRHAKCGSPRAGPCGWGTRIPGFGEDRSAPWRDFDCSLVGFGVDVRLNG